MNDSNVTFTDPTVLVTDWSFLAIIQIITCVIAFFLNSLVLYCYAHYRRLRTPFSIYLMALCTSNLAHAIFASPVDILKTVHSNYILGARTCDFYIYVAYNTAGTTLNLHMLISLNRIWAIAHPFSYRTTHTARTAALACLLTTVYVHLICVPGIVQDALYYRIAGACFINGKAQPKWATSMQILIFSLPILLIALVYPFVTWKHCQRKKHVPHEFHTAVDSERRMSVFPRTTHINPRPSVHLRKESMSRAFVVLTLLTISLIICETPINTFYLVMTVAPCELPLLETVGVVLYSLQPALDPVLFIVSFVDLRVQLYRTVFCR